MQLNAVKPERNKIFEVSLLIRAVGMQCTEPGKPTSGSRHRPGDKFIYALYLLRGCRHRLYYGMIDTRLLIPREQVLNRTETRGGYTVKPVGISDRSGSDFFGIYMTVRVDYVLSVSDHYAVTTLAAF